MTEIEWLDELLMFGKAHYLDDPINIWVCGKHPLLTSWTSTDSYGRDIACKCPEMLYKPPLKIPIFVIGFCCALKDYRVQT